MRYIQRDGTGKMLGHYSHAHDYASEEVPDDHADVKKWASDRMEAKAAAMVRKAALNPELLLARIVELEDKLKERER